MDEGPYTTISVSEFNRFAGTIHKLRWKIQKAREFLESGRIEEAKMLLLKEEE